jgi:phosphate transport system permease protein
MVSPGVSAGSRWPDRVLALAAWAAAATILATVALIVGDVIVNGMSKLSWEFLTVGPRNAGRDGGIGPIIVSTLLILAVAVSTALPVGLGTALFLTEFSGKQTKKATHLIRRSLDALAGVPSIVFGLFGSVFFCQIMGLGFSILAGGLTLACMMLPILIRTLEIGLAAVPPEYRLGAAALSYSKTATIWHISLPAALPALGAGLVLSLGRALAETAALIFTSGYVDRMPESLLDSGRSMSVHIFDLSMNVGGGDAAAYATSLTLVLVLVVINGCANYLTKSRAMRIRA